MAMTTAQLCHNPCWPLAPAHVSTVDSFWKDLTKFAAKKPCREFLVTKHYWIHVLFNRMAWPFWILAADGVTSSRGRTSVHQCISAAPYFCTRNCWWFRNPANQLRLVLYPVIMVFYIPAGAGFHSINKKTLCATRGSNTLFLAERLPSSLVVGVSNSHGQRGNDTQSTLM